MREKASQGLRTFALTADVKEAHRQIPVDPRDWHLHGCQLDHGADVFINTVGTFCIASSSYCWSRVASAMGRLTKYLADHRAETWHMVVADDYHLEAGGAHYRLALLMFFVFCSTVGVESLSPGTLRVEATSLSVSGSNFPIEPDTWASRSAELNCWRGGRARQQTQRTSTWQGSSRDWGQSCS